MLLGAEAMTKLHNSRVAVFGVGGVGGYTVEALARSGVGALDLIDDDKVCLTNLNRQIIATRKTVAPPPHAQATWTGIVVPFLKIPCKVNKTTRKLITLHAISTCGLAFCA